MEIRTEKEQKSLSNNFRIALYRISPSKQTNKKKNLPLKVDYLDTFESIFHYFQKQKGRFIEVHILSNRTRNIETVTKRTVYLIAGKSVLSKSMCLVT